MNEVYEIISKTRSVSISTFCSHKKSSPFRILYMLSITLFFPFGTLAFRVWLFLVLTDARPAPMGHRQLVTVTSSSPVTVTVTSPSPEQFRLPATCRLAAPNRNNYVTAHMDWRRAVAARAWPIPPCSLSEYDPATRPLSGSVNSAERRPAPCARVCPVYPTNTDYRSLKRARGR